MTIAVFDTNTLASGAVAPPGGTLATLVDAFLTELFVLALSAPIDGELERALQKPYFARRLPAALRTRYLASVRSVALMVPITVEVHSVATHPQDDLVLATALSAGADFLVTGDIPFRTRVPRYQGVTLLSPREFLEVLRRQGTIP